MKKIYSITMLNKSSSKDVQLMQRTYVAESLEDAQGQFALGESKNPEFIAGQLNGGWTLATHNDIPMSTAERPIETNQVVNALMVRMSENDKRAWGIGRKVLTRAELQYLTEICNQD